MTAPTTDRVIHGLQNHLAVSVGFCDLLVSERRQDPRTEDLLRCAGPLDGRGRRFRKSPDGFTCDGRGREMKAKGAHL